NVLNSGNDLQFSVMTNREHKEEAYEVLDFLLEDENLQDYINDQNAVPCKEGDFELAPMLDGMKSYIEEGKVAYYHDHYYPIDMSEDAMIQTSLLGDSEFGAATFMVSFYSEWVRQNRQLVRIAQEYMEEDPVDEWEGGKPEMKKNHPWGS